MRFSVLASGSRGNAALIRSGGCGLLIDIGLGPRVLTQRLASVQASWDSIAAVILTHTHGDHINEFALRHLANWRVVLFCHAAHVESLRTSKEFRALQDRGQVRCYDDRPWLGPAGMRIEPIALSHDDAATHGFRIEAREGRWKPLASLGYLADSGHWTQDHVESLVEVAILGVEFNHDVELQRNSGRPPHLIERVMGPRGHLSNDQGLALVSSVLAQSRAGTVKTVVLLHLSQQCNRPELALAAARVAIRQSRRRVKVVVAEQFNAAPDVCAFTTLNTARTKRATSLSNALEP